MTLVGIAVAVVGLVLLTDPGGGGRRAGFGKGELLTLGCAVAFAAHVVILGRDRPPPRPDPPRRRPGDRRRRRAARSPGFWLGGYGFPAPALVAAIATALVATALAFVLQVTGQRDGPAGAGRAAPARSSRCSRPSSPPSPATPSQPSQLAGAALILVAVVVSARSRPEWLDRRVSDAGGWPSITIVLSTRPGGPGLADPKKPRAPFAPWDRRELPGIFTVEESARRVGNYKWIEMRLFEVLGGWVATVPELDVKLRLGTHCYHHAWHAELWHKRLPELREMNPERLTAPAERRAGRLRRRA